MKIILASASPRRAEILSAAGIPFQVRAAKIDESRLTDESPEAMVERLARSKAEDLAKRVKAGEPLAKAAKGLGAEAKTSAPFARNGQVSDLGSATQFNAAFGMNVDQVSDALPVAANWVVYRIVTHDNPKMEELILQKPQLEQQLLQTKQQASYDAFKTALQNRLKSEGKIVIDAANLKAITDNS